MRLPRGVRNFHRPSCDQFGCKVVGSLLTAICFNKTRTYPLRRILWISALKLKNTMEQKRRAPASYARPHVVNGVFWLDGHNLGHGGRIVFRRHRALRGRSGARLQRVTLFTPSEGAAKTRQLVRHGSRVMWRVSSVSRHVMCPPAFGGSSRKAREGCGNHHSE